jgi:hypothetical protein
MRRNHLNLKNRYCIPYALDRRSKKTSTITFRLDDDTIKRLRSESLSKQVSTNTLVNQALRRFLDWDLHESSAGFVSLSKPVFLRIFNNLKQKDVIDIASHLGKSEIQNIALFMRGKMDLKSFLSWFELRMTNSNVHVNHVEEDDLHRYVMKHDLGKNWSLYNKTILELIFKDVFHKKIEINIDKKVISFEIRE